MVTIRSVAEAAQVSVTSVSNYMNGRHEKMGLKTKTRIERAIEQLQYVPSPAARGLKLNKQFTVGMVVSEPAPYFRLGPFIGTVFSGLVTDLSKNGYACLLQGNTDCSSPASFIPNYSRTDALCVFLAGNHRHRKQSFEALAQLQKPIVAIQEHELLPGPDSTLLRQDDMRGGYELANHLVARGARSFIYFGPSFPWPGNEMREKGIRAALKEHGLVHRMKKVTCGLGTVTDARVALTEWWSSHAPADAIIANNDQIGIAVLTALSDLGVSVPSDVMVTGFKTAELWHYSNPSLTSIVSPAYRLGQVAAELLLERLRTGVFSKKEVVLPVTLDIGGSTASRSE